MKMSGCRDWNPIASTEYNPLAAGSIDGTDEEPHDHAVVRALQAKYRPNSRAVGNPINTLFVARLHPKTTKDTLIKVFSRYGNVISCRLVVDLVTGLSKRYAFVEFESERGCHQARRDANKSQVDGCEIFVDYECARTLNGWIPRRLGGGLGGKKESGQLRFGGRDRPFRKPIVIQQQQQLNRNRSQSHHQTIVT